MSADRQAAARRVARETACVIVTAIRTRPDTTVFNDHTQELLEREIVLALLAFPGGDAEPVAYRVVVDKAKRHMPEYHALARSEADAREKLEEIRHIERVAGGTGLVEPATIEPLYAAPGAGDALRQAVEQIAALRPDYTNPEDYVRQIREIIRAALAPGGRPRCETCGGSGYVWESGYPVKREPCPACAPAAAGDADAR